MDLFPSDLIEKPTQYLIYCPYWIWKQNLIFFWIREARNERRQFNLAKALRCPGGSGQKAGLPDELVKKSPGMYLAKTDIWFKKSFLSLTVEKSIKNCPMLICCKYAQSGQPAKKNSKNSNPEGVWGSNEVAKLSFDGWTYFKKVTNFLEN
jgi:hypothetical protein